MTIGVLESHMGGIGNLLKRVSAYDTRPSAVCFLFRFTPFLLFLIFMYDSSRTVEICIHDKKIS